MLAFKIKVLIILFINKPIPYLYSFYGIKKSMFILVAKKND